MSGPRQVFLGLFMTLLSSAIVLGSLSLSLVESGYRLGQAPSGPLGEMLFSGEPVLQLAGSEPQQASPSAPSEVVVILTPTSNVCVHPAGWIKIIVRPEHTLRTLAHLYDTSVALLKAGNCMKTESLVVNSELYVPPAPPRTPTPRPRPTYRPPVYPTPYPTVPPWYPTRTPVTPPTQPPPTSPPPTQPPPPTLPPPPPPTSPPPTQPPPTSPPPTEPPPPTSPPPTEPPPPTSPPPTEPPPPPPTAQQPPPPPPTAPPPEPTLPPPPATPLAPGQPL